jgi:hypothetical protein
LIWINLRSSYGVCTERDIREEQPLRSLRDSPSIEVYLTMDSGNGGFF